MDNMKNGVHADTAEAENTETMDLLPECSMPQRIAATTTRTTRNRHRRSKKLPAKNPRPENNNRREKPTVLFNEQSVRTVRTLTVSSILGRSRTKEDSGE